MEENHYNCIYMYTNKINGKGYVGKAEDFLIRKQQHIYRSYNKKVNDYNVPFHRAIRKYGIESFEVTILKENIPLCLLSFYEDYYADKYDVYANHGKGYNVAKCGGGGNTLLGKTEEERKEIRQKQSEAKKGKNHPMYGVHRYGKNAPNTKRVAQYDKQGNLIKIWDYIKQASEELGIHKDSISACCRGKQKSAGGYIWRYAEKTE